MWSYKTPVGTFFIYYAAHASQLRINDKIITAHCDQTVLADKVANFSTGFSEYDFLRLDPSVKPPQTLKGWTHTKSF